MSINHGFADDIEHIGLIKRTPEGHIVQIGMTQEQQTMLKLSLAAISQDSPMVRMPEQYDLVLKSEVTP
ncbi:hypothetical protein [Psychrobacter sp. 4Bb]|uniref:hypothetical protein n=1 Tax=Psychrobacter sp. 4Bb TaxID=888436 RepID=UPI000C7B2A8B|nr:hypothetical protein [Psychrobacter sp. 4Bb]PKH81123.1 hypothetical protein CXF60_06050 [Psychrobacter sp. 4Bb]|tara:strand:+ start:117 stop:323 length:207 start_codon:yes stop_codon:yes gene_type:complete